MDQAAPTRFTPPALFGLCATKGLTTGIVSVAFPFIAARQGLSMAAIGTVVGLTALAATVKLIATPVVDLGGTMRGWVVGMTLVSAVLTAALLIVPITPATIGPIALLAFAGALTAEIASIAIGGLLALTVDPRRLGAASAYYQGGILVFQGLGGGFALWAATHWGLAVTGAILGLVALLPAVAMLGATEPHRPHLAADFGGRLAAIGRDLAALARVPRSRYVLVAFCTPIGVGGASYLWSGVASDWGASADLVSLATGVGAALVSALGALVYGRVVDRFDRIASFLVSGLVLVGAALLVVLLPRTPFCFAATTLIYAFFMGFSYTAFTALQYETVGSGAAASKGALLNAVGNLPVAYMPALLGLAQTRGSTSAMLWCEIGVTTAFIAGFALLRPRHALARNPAAPALG